MYMSIHRYICICICIRKAQDLENRIHFQFLCSQRQDKKIADTITIQAEEQKII